MIKNCILHIALCLATYPLLAQQTNEKKSFKIADQINKVDSIHQSADTLIAKSQDSLQALRAEWQNKIDNLNLPDDKKNQLDSLSKKYNFSPQFFAEWENIKRTIDLNNTKIHTNEIDQWLNENKSTFEKYSALIDQSQNIIPGKFNQYNENIKQNIPDSARISQYKPNNVDQLVEEQALKNEQVQELQKQTVALGDPTEGITGKGDELNQQMEQAQDLAYLRRQAAQKAYMVANDVASEQMEQLQTAMGSMQKYKKKYWSVDNSADVDAGIEKPKRVEPLSKHWSWGGNFQFDRSNPLGIDLAPTLLYSFNRTFSLGTSLTWRYKFDKDNDYKPPRGEDMTYGVRLFGQYKVIRTFFVQAEYEKISMPAEGRSWQQAFNAGVGKTFTISGKLKGNITILYNLNHNRSGIYEKPWLVRFGVMR